MNKLTENQKKWLAALRSGKFKKGTEYLNRGNKFCCLGVASEIFKTESVKIRTRDNREAMVSYDNDSVSAPYYVMEALCLRSEIGSSKDLQQPNMANLNDNLGRFGEDIDFNRLADYIEENAESYFKQENNNG